MKKPQLGLHYDFADANCNQQVVGYLLKDTFDIYNCICSINLIFG